MRKALLMSVALLLILPGSALAGGGGHTNPCPGFSEGAELGMEDSCYDGVAHFVPAGSSVTVRNHGNLPHSVTAVDGSFDSGLLQPGDTFEVAVDDPGVVRVYCTLHGTTAGEGMAGVLIVGDPAVTAEDSAVSARVEGLAPPGVEVTGERGWRMVTGAALALALTALVVSIRHSRPTGG